jgi:hypothetical protein
MMKIEFLFYFQRNNLIKFRSICLIIGLNIYFTTEYESVVSNTKT